MKMDFLDRFAVDPGLGDSHLAENGPARGLDFRVQGARVEDGLDGGQITVRRMAARKMETIFSISSDGMARNTD